MSLLVRLVLIGYLLATGSAHAFVVEKTLDVSQIDQTPASLSEYFAVLEDPGQTLTFADVQRPDVESRFKSGQAPGSALIYGFTDSAYWLRLKLRNTSDQALERMLELGHASLGSVELHQPTAAGNYEKISTGSRLPFASRPYKNRSFVFPLTLQAHSEAVYYLRIQSANALIVPGRLWQPNAFHIYERNDYLAQAWFFGMVTAIAMFNLLLSVAVRDKLYLLYASAILLVALAVAAEFGLAKEFLWPNANAWWSEIAGAVGVALAVIVYIQFTRQMLNTKKIVPRLDVGMRLWAGAVAFLVIGIFVSYQAVVNLAALVVVLTIAGGSTSAWSAHSNVSETLTSFLRRLSCLAVARSP